MKKNIFVYLLIINSLNAFSQTIPQPKSLLDFAYTATSNDIANKIRQNGNAVYQAQDWNQVELFVMNHNNKIDDNIRQIDQENDALFLQLKDLSEVNDLPELQKQLDILKESRKQMIGETEKQLHDRIKFKGLYLGITQSPDFFTDDSVLSKRIQWAIIPDAVSSLNGVFINSLEVLENDALAYSTLKERVSGSMQLSNSFFKKRNNATRYFCEVIEVEVSPLETMNMRIAITDSSLVQAQVLDLYRYGSVSLIINELKSRINNPDILNNLETWLNTNLSSKKEFIKQNNELVLTSEKKILDDLKVRLDNLDKEIKSLEKEIDNKKKRFSQIAKPFNLTVDYNNPKTTIEKIKTNLKTKFAENNARKQAEKGNEFVAEYFKVMAAGGVPIDAISKEAFNRSRTIEDAHKEVLNFVREIELTNQTVTGFSQAQSRSVYRNLDKYWLYIVPNDEFWEVGIVAKFKLTSNGTNVTPTPPKPVLVVASGSYEFCCSNLKSGAFGGNSLGVNFCAYECEFNNCSFSINFDQQKASFSSVYKEKTLFGCVLPVVPEQTFSAVSKTFQYDKATQEVSIQFGSATGTDFGYIMLFKGKVIGNQLQGNFSLERPTFNKFKGYLISTDINLTKR